jgi:hypothetical protein
VKLKWVSYACASYFRAECLIARDCRKMNRSGAERYVVAALSVEKHWQALANLRVFCFLIALVNLTSRIPIQNF